jgi:hypothetical protein
MPPSWQPFFSHEKVQAAGARMIVRAMNDFLRQDDLNEHVRMASETMALNQEDYARSAGRDFPHLAGQFIQGMLSPKRTEVPTMRDASASAQEEKPSPRLESGSAESTGDASPSPTVKNHRDPPEKSNSFLGIPALVEGGLRQRLGSGHRGAQNDVQ